MTDAFERKLRGALKPVDPGEDFAAGVIARLSESDKAGDLPDSDVSRFTTPTRPTHRLMGRWLAVAMAASIVIAVVVGVRIREEHEREAGRRATEQLREALKVTSEKLNLAYRVVHDQSQDTTPDKSQSDRKPDKPDHSGA
jgi:hypothetical protein